MACGPAMKAARCKGELQGERHRALLVRVSVGSSCVR